MSRLTTTDTQRIYKIQTRMIVCFKAMNMNFTNPLFIGIALGRVLDNDDISFLTSRFTRHQFIQFIMRCIKSAGCVSNHYVAERIIRMNFSVIDQAMLHYPKSFWDRRVFRWIRSLFGSQE